MPILRNSQIQLGPEGLEFGASGSRKHEVCRHVSSSDVRSLCMPATIVVPETYHKGLWPRMSPESVWEEVLYRSPPFWEQCYFGNFHQALTGPKLRSLWQKAFAADRGSTFQFSAPAPSSCSTS